MDICNCIVPSRHRGSVNSRRAQVLVRLVERLERWEDPDDPQGVLPRNWSVTEQFTCVVLKAKANDNRKILGSSHDEFHGL
ncbi:uncharacterized protein TNCV_3110441 [Trichonephila clavipes]|nr:uncharacterized protein TNCV_3110441 [Trichonephila clavipes]